MSNRKRKKDDKERGFDRSGYGMGHLNLGTHFHRRKDKCSKHRRRDKTYKEER